MSDPTSPFFSSRKLQALLHAASILALLGVSVACGADRSGGRGGDDCANDDDCLRSESCIFDAADDAEGECKETASGNNNPTPNNNPVPVNNNPVPVNNNPTPNNNPGNNNPAPNNNPGNNSTNNNTGNSNNSTGNSNNSTGNSNNNTDPGNNTPTPGTPEDYTGYNAPASYIHAMSVETDGRIGDDVDGDGQADNALGNLLSNLSGLLGGTDINALLQASIDAGQLSLGMTWPGLTELATATRTNLDFFNLYPDPSGEPFLFLADPSSFIPGSSTPEIRFRRASLDLGDLSAGPSTFRVALPVNEAIALDLNVELARLQGFAAEDSPGISLTNGTLSGAVPLASLYAAINAYIDSPSCSCITGNTPLINIGSGENHSCNQLNSSACQDDQEICGTIAGACSLLLGIVGGEADIDLDNDGSNDALSVFLRLEASGALITGPAAN